MRVATWNVNGLRARLDFVLAWLADRRPDIVGIQEVKSEEPQFPDEALREAGYHAVHHLQKSWNGVAVLTREPVEAVVERGLPGEAEFGSRLISVDALGLRFTTVYVPNGKSVEHEDYPRKLAWLESLAAWLKTDGGGRPHVLCGDFNVVPEPLDSWDEAGLAGTVFHTGAERERYRAALEAGGLSDLFRAKFPAERQYSWWDYRGGAFHKRQGLRIDFLLGDARTLGRLRSVEIDREYRKKKGELTPSDHAPVIADLE